MRKENKEYSGESDSDDGEDDDEKDDYVFKERKFNFISEFAILAEYGVLAKIISLIENDQLLDNDANLNQAVFKFFKRICELLKAEWLFYQMDFLNVFHEIISNDEIRVKFLNIL